jgi:hypothetical protein
VYSIVFTAGSYYLFKLAWAGPPSDEEPSPTHVPFTTWMWPGTADRKAVTGAQGE